MSTDKSNKVLLWISGALIVLLVGGFAFRKYLDMRMAGASGGDAFLFMIVVFLGTLAVVGIAIAFVFLYMIPEGEKAHHGWKKMRRKKQLPSETTKEKEIELIPIPNHEESVREQEQELVRKREELLRELSAYTTATFQKILKPSQIELLISNIRHYLDGISEYVAVEDELVNLSNR